MELEQLCAKLRISVSEVAQYIKGEFGKVQSTQIEQKELNSLVSYVDQQGEKMLVEALTDFEINASFLTEEETVERDQKDYQWIIDPLDGTTNFLYGIPFFSVSVALYYKKEALIGVVHNVMTDEQFYAIKGNGAYCNELPIHISNKDELKESLIATGFPYRNDYNSMQHASLLAHWFEHSRGIRRLGSAALDLCYTACGKFQAYYESMLNPWDIAAGALIVKEAGGVLCNYMGDTFDPFAGEVIATNKHLQSEIVSVVSRLKQ